MGDSEKKAHYASYVFLRCFAAMAMLWLSFPPVGWAWLGWLALAPLVSVVVDKAPLTRGQFWIIWLSGLLYWLAAFYFIPIPHPLLWLGWIVISLYLACYLPFFVLASRTMIHRFGILPVIAIPVSWVGLELARCYLFTGMGLVCLSHTQYRIPEVIQVSDLSGAYTLSFAMMVFTTAVYLLLFRDNRISKPSWPYLLIAAAAIGGVIAYGQYQLNFESKRAAKALNVALIQGSIDPTFPDTVEEAHAEYQRKTEQYINLTNEASRQWDDIDLVVWPENGWPFPDLEPNTDKSMMPLEEVRIYESSVLYIWPQLFVSGRKMPHFLVGAETRNPVENERYGSAIFISGEGEVTHRYYKNHLVMCGEYVPLADWIPLLRKIPAIGTGLNAGTDSITIDVNGTKIAPSICFETTVPHYIRNQLDKLTARGEEPDVMVNVTNDGWFYGTSCLDFHLACNVFRAVEMRKPHLVCANTGFSAHINEKGQILQQGPRQSTETIRAEVSRVDRSSPYRLIGDWIPISFAAITILAGLFGLIFNPSRPNQNILHDVPGETTDKPDRASDKN